MSLLSEDDQRELYDAFHLQVRYHRATHQATLQVTIYADAVGELAKKINTISDPEQPNKIYNDQATPVADTPATAARSHVVGAPGGSRTAWERAATGGGPTFVVIDGVWPLPSQG